VALFKADELSIPTNGWFQEKNLKSMLHKWSGIEWNIVICKQDKINSLKQELLKKAKASEDFTVIKNNFPNADVSDIILKS
jgi:hypothetical protein